MQDTFGCVITIIMTHFVNFSDTMISGILQKTIPNWSTWLKAAGIRAVRTFAESALAYISTSSTVLGDVNWLGVLFAGAFGAVTAMLLALTGLPEAEE